MGQGVCTPYFVELRDGQNNMVHSQAMYNVNIIFTGGTTSDIEFYENLANCAAGGGPNSMAVSLNDRKTLWVKGVTTGGPYTINAVDLGGNLSQGSFGTSLQAPGANNTFRLVADFYRAPNLEVAETESCIGFYAMAFDANGELTNFNGSDSFDPTMAELNDTGMTSYFQISPDCSSSAIAGAQTPPSTTSGFEMFLDIAGNAFSAGDKIDAILIGCGAVNCPDDPLFVVAPGSFEHIHPDLVFQNNQQAGDCLKIKVGAYDNHQPNSYPVLFPSATTIGFVDNNSITSGMIIDSAITPPTPGVPFTCDMATTGQFLSYNTDFGPASMAQSDFYFYYRPSTSGSNVLDIDISYQGETRNITRDIAPESLSGGFLESQDHPVVDFGSRTVGDGTVMMTVNFQNTGSATIAGLALNNSMGAGFSINSNNGCSVGSMVTGGTCSVDIDFDNVTPNSYSGFLYIDYTDANVQSRRTLIEVKGLRTP